MYSCYSWHGVLEKKLDGVWWGGRAVAVTADPTDNKIVFVGSETGGVFRSTNGGTLWGHIDSIPAFNCFDIRICPDAPSVIIATFKQDSRTINGGGIWVSTDGGKRWRQPPTSIPEDEQGNPKRISAYGICYQHLTSNVFVGTDSGIAVSHDFGDTWFYIDPNPSGRRDTVSSIVSVFPGKLVIYGSGGIM